MKLVSIKKGPSDPLAVIETLEKLLERAKQGDFRSIMVMAEQEDGQIFTCGSECEDRFRVAGSLLEAAVRRLGFEYNEAIDTL